MRKRHDSCVRDLTHVLETWLMYKRHDSCIRDMTAETAAPFAAAAPHLSYICIYETWLIFPVYVYKRHDSSFLYMFRRDMTLTCETLSQFRNSSAFCSSGPTSWWAPPGAFGSRCGWAQVWVMFLMYESCLSCMSHVSHVWVMCLMYESCLLCF